MTDTYSWVEELTDLDPVDASRVVLESHSVRRVNGVLLDVQTANVIVTVHDALSDPGKARLRALSLTRAAEICWKVVNNS